MRFQLVLAPMVCFASLAAQAPREIADLRKIGHVGPKGRVQDKEYNPSLPVVDKLIQAGPASIPFLISKLEDETKVKGPVLDFWGDMRVGDVAWTLLCDLFTTDDWKHSTISPGLGTIIEIQDAATPAWEAWRAQIRKDGRAGIRRKVERILKPYGGRFDWDLKQRCFRPAIR